MFHVVCGPPGSGKTTYVRNKMRWGDVVIDTDAIYQAISGQPYYDKPDGLLDLVFSIRDFVLSESVRNNKSVWLIMGGSRAADRASRRQDGAVTIVLETSYFECLRRVRNDDRRKGKLALWEPLIKKWWDSYEPSDQDIVIRD